MNPRNQAFYDMVAEELKTQKLDQGMWVRAFSDAGGNENQAKALYIKYRVAQLESTVNDILKTVKKEESRLKKEKFKDNFISFDSTDYVILIATIIFFIFIVLAVIHNSR
jgi:hypothetical protein